jgi:glycosyltransferase involved in cell wall biosynthesis
VSSSVTASPDPSSVRVLIVAEHASAKFGGEAFLPLHYFRLLRARGVEAWLVTHERVRSELVELLPSEVSRMHFVRDTPFQVAVWRFGERLPAQIGVVTTQALLHLDTQLRQRELVRRLVREHGIDVVHEPIPVSPKQPSALFDVGAPVVIGPMNGGMTYPYGFRELEGRAERAAHGLAVRAANLANLAIPGKRRARLLLVANERTRRALPEVVRAVETEELVENGVDLERFSPSVAPRDDHVLRVAFVGRLVDWKAVDVLVGAVAKARKEQAVELEIFGDGPERPALEARAAGLGVASAVTFHGFVPQVEVARRLSRLDALALSSVRECGGAVVLEAMALGLPVVATRWGGPADYLDHGSGILVDPHSRAQMTRDFADAFVRLAADRPYRERLGAAARTKVLEYDWNVKIDRILALYARVAGRESPRPL